MKDQTLNPSDQRALRKQLQDAGLPSVCERAQLDRLTLLRAATGLPVTVGTRAQISVYLGNRTEAAR